MSACLAGGLVWESGTRLGGLLGKAGSRTLVLDEVGGAGTGPRRPPWAVRSGEERAEVPALPVTGVRAGAGFWARGDLASGEAKD